MWTLGFYLWFFLKQLFFIKDIVSISYETFGINKIKWKFKSMPKNDSDYKYFKSGKKERS